MSTKRCVFLTNADPTRVTRLSGTPYFMLRALQAELGTVEIVRDYKPRLLRKLDWWVARASGGARDWNYLPFVNRWLARRLERRFGGPDTVFLAALCSAVAGPLARRNAVVNISDGTFEAVYPMYPAFQRLSARSVRAAAQAERDCIARARHNSFSSDWAAHSAIVDYGADPARVSAIAWGCNLDWIEAPAGEHDGGCNLLFIGADWARKGGDVVLDTCAVLAQRGFAFRADLVGGLPDAERAPIPGVTLHGRLSKDAADEAATLQRLLGAAAFLFLPTRQDCTPMVFAEAMAFGAPGITRDVGGIASVVRDGVDGLVLPPDATAEQFASAIIAAWEDRPRYFAMRHAARAAYETRLNWQAWAAALHSRIADLPG